MRRTTAGPAGLSRLALSLALSALAAPAPAGEVTAFATRCTPSGIWGTGFGASLSSTWFKAVNLEAEAARLPGVREEESMTTFTGSAFLAPPLGILVPYAGVGVGLHRQSSPIRSDTGTLAITGIGARLILKDLLVIRVDYRWIHLSEDAPLPLDKRLYAGLGLKF